MNDAMLYPISVPKPESAEDLIGYIDSLGHVVVPPKYASGSYFSEGVAVVGRADGLCALIDESGILQSPFAFEGLGRFQEGLCVAYTRSTAGYIDHSGKFQVPARYCIACEFSEGMACVSVDGENFGYIDDLGRFVISPQFEQARRFASGLAAVRRDGELGYLNREGRLVIRHQFDGPRAQPFTNGLAGVCYRGRWGFIEYSGDWVIVPQYEDVGCFAEGVAPVRLDGQWGLIALDGSARFVPKFGQLGEVEWGMAPASYNGAAGFVSPSGEWAIAPEFDRCTRFYGALAAVQKGDYYCFIRRNGRIVWTSQQYAMLQAPPFVE